MGFEVGEQFGVERHAVLDHFAQSGAILARREGVERRGVDQHAERLEERPDHVLRLRQIDADLAADGAVDLGEQRRRDLQEADAAGVGGGDEAGQVADHSAADGDDQRTAIGLQLEEALPQPGGHVDRLRLLARLHRDDENVDLFGQQAFGRAES